MSLSNNGNDELPGSSSLSGDSNSNESINSNTLNQKLSDVVSFSLCALCAIRCRYLYSEPYHEPFRDLTIKKMIEHFKLPPKVERSVGHFEADDEFTLLSSIKQNHRERTFNIVDELVLLSIKSGTYDARMHYLIVDVAELLGIPRELVEMHCENIYELLLRAQKAFESGETPISDPETEKYLEKRDNRKKIKKYLLIGLASLGGGAVIGVTGGLAAPIVASAFGAVIGAGSVVMSTAAAGVVGSIFGVAGAGLTASKMNKRIGDLEEFSFQSLSPENDQTSLTVTIAISGWITEESEQQFSKPWKNLRHTKEQYCLRYESKYLLELSQAMDYILSMVVSYAAQEALKYTFLAGVMAAIAWPTALITMANIIDNPWDVCIGRSAEAGKHLADILMSRQQGQRPVSLIGFSLGARVIFFCLQELSQRKNSEGIICDVILLGAPVTASLDQWRPLGRIISGRIINGYSSSDWLLKFLYRTSSAAIRVAGLQPLRWKDRRVSNVDLTALVGGHMDYYKKLTEILEFINIRTLVKTEDDLIATSLTATTNFLKEETTNSDIFSVSDKSEGESVSVQTNEDTKTKEKFYSPTSDSGIGPLTTSMSNLMTSYQAPLANAAPEQLGSVCSPNGLIVNNHLEKANGFEETTMNSSRSISSLSSSSYSSLGLVAHLNGCNNDVGNESYNSTAAQTTADGLRTNKLGLARNSQQAAPINGQSTESHEAQKQSGNELERDPKALRNHYRQQKHHQLQLLHSRCRPSSLARKRPTDLRFGRLMGSSRSTGNLPDARSF